MSQSDESAEETGIVEPGDVASTQPESIGITESLANNDGPGPRTPGLARASGIIGLVTLLSRVLGLVRDTVTATLFGAGSATDAFFVAFKIPNLLRSFVAEGSMAAAFVPVFTDELHTSTDRARRALAAVTSFSVLLTITLTILGIFFAPELNRLFAPGFTADPAREELAASLTRIMFPYIVFVSLIALADGVLNSLGRFGIATMAPAIINVTMIVAALVAHRVFDEPVYALAWGVLAGGILGLLPPLWQLRRLGYRLSFGKIVGEPAIRRLVLLMLPSLVSASLYQLLVFANTVLASLQGEGSVSWLYYADRLFQFPLGVFSMAIATAILPMLSRHASRNDHEGLRAQLLAALNWVTFVTVPAAVGMSILAEPLIALVYRHGHFSASSSAQTALALRAYALGLWPLSCQSVLVRSFIAKKNSLLPALISCFVITCNVAFSIALMGPPTAGATTSLALFVTWAQEALAIRDLGHVGIALGGSLSAYLSVLSLFMILPRINVQLSLRPFLAALFRAITASLVMALVVSAIGKLDLPLLLSVFFAVTSGVVVFLMTSLLLGASEAQVVWRRLMQVLRLGDRFSTKPEGN